MNTRTHISGVQLAEVLKMALRSPDEDDATSSEDIPSLLRQRLASPLPLPERVVDNLPAMLVQFQKEMLPGEGLSAGRLLLQSDTSLNVLREVKRYGKDISRQDQDPEGGKYSVGITIYYAALAAAIVFHHQRITSYSYGFLADSFGVMAHKEWMPATLSRLFLKASASCRDTLRHSHPGGVLQDSN